MEKTLNKNGYVVKKKDLTIKQTAQLRKDLTVEPFIMNEYGKKGAKRVQVEVYQESEKDFCIPKYYGVQKFGEPTNDTLNNRDYIQTGLQFNIPLRDYQKIIMKTIIKELNIHQGGIITMGCGRGKTNMALYLMAKLGLKTLIITHAEFLQNQIIDRLSANTNIKDIGGVGHLHGKIVDLKHPVVVATVQSLSTKDYPVEYLADIGLVIIDETHHMGGKSFCKAFFKINAPYMLGLTATPRRADGMFKVINWYIGPQLYYEEQPAIPEVRCKFINFSMEKENINFTEYLIPGGDTPNRSKMITNLTLIKSRNTIIIELIKQSLFTDGVRNKRKILVLSGRIDHLKLLQYKLNIDGIKTGLYIGELEEEELLISAEADVIFGSYQMAQEGLDIDGLNTLFLVTPKSDIQQGIGRILRKPIEEYEEIPLIIDFYDALDIFENQKTKRHRYYDTKSYQCKKYKISDTCVKKEDFEERIKKIIKLHTVALVIKEDKKERISMFLED